jgi:hypothetical protein
VFYVVKAQKQGTAIRLVGPNFADIGKRKAAHYFGNKDSNDQSTVLAGMAAGNIAGDARKLDLKFSALLFT